MLKKMNDKLYIFNTGKGIRFLMKLQDIGIWGSGKAWCLRMLENGNESTISCYVVKSDGNDCEKRYSADGKVWSNIKEIITAAERIIFEMC